MPDFFVSYTSVDSAWAEWIAFVLEEEGFDVIIQAWDFRPGSNFVLEMQNAASIADRTIMVLSPDYLNSQFASTEWAAAFANDAQGLERKLVPVEIRPCRPVGLLTSIVRIRIAEEDEQSARRLLIDGVRQKRAKPSQRPTYPGAVIATPHKPFPGSAKTPSSGPSSPAPYMPNLKRRFSDIDKRLFARQAFDATRAHFETGLQALSEREPSLQFDFQPVSTTEFRAEIFINGDSARSCRIWQGGHFSENNICYYEGRQGTGDSCNEILAVSADNNNLFYSAMMDMGMRRHAAVVDDRMSSEEAAEYLWRLFVEPLERHDFRRR
jgi:hypothetical protein